jgi:sugar O-acyltransferase (sialic acid O-acetyltransferase NeuD family)
MDIVKRSLINFYGLQQGFTLIATKPQGVCAVKSKKIVIIGAGGCGRELLDVFEAYNQEKAQYEVLGFIVQKEYALAGEMVNGYPVLGDFEWFDKNARYVHAVCAVGASHHRHRLVNIASSFNVKFCSVIHPSVLKSRWVDIGAGSVIGAGCVLTTQIKIGNHVYVNYGCTIGHDVVLEDFTTVLPGAHISGSVTVHTGCYIGTGVSVIEKIYLGEWSIVGAGSTIIKDVPANSTVVGSPGRVVKERSAGWYL